jgi:hypothetical protein
MQLVFWTGSLLGYAAFTAVCCLLFRLRDLEDKVDRVKIYTQQKGEDYGESCF